MSGRVRPHPAVGDFGYSSVRRDVSGRGPQTSAPIIGGNGSQRGALDFSFLFPSLPRCRSAPKSGLALRLDRLRRHARTDASPGTCMMGAPYERTEVIPRPLNW